MSMVPYDLIAESIIRDGLEDIKANPTILDDIFGNLASNYGARKYGLAEIQKIKDLLTGTNPTTIAIVHSFHATEGKSPFVAIQLGQGAESQEHAHLEDFEEDELRLLNATELAGLIKVSNIIPTSFDPVTGRVSVDDTVDLSSVSASYLFEDGSAVEHVIQAGFSNIPGNKFFFIPTASSPDLINPGLIKSFLTEKIVEQRGVFDRVQVLLAVGSKEPLFTKYLSTLIHFFFLSRKKDLIDRGFIISSVSYSDFSKDSDYKGDQVYTRFLTLHGEVNHTWDDEMVNLIDSVEIEAVPVECPSE